MIKNRRQVMTLPAMLTLLIFALFPLIIMFYTSFISDATGAFSMENYGKFFSNMMYLKITRTSIFISLAVTLISLVIAYPLAYIMAKKLKGLKNIIFDIGYHSFFYESAGASLQLVDIPSRRGNVEQNFYEFRYD